MTSSEIDRIKFVTDEKNCQIGLKPRSIKPGKDESKLNFSGKVLHIEYQGYNKVFNLDFLGLTVRIVTNETVHKEYGEMLDVHFAKKDMFLFGKSNNQRVL